MDALVHQATHWKGIHFFINPHENEYMLKGWQGDNWNELLKEIITFNSVEEFWGVYV